MIDIAQLEKLTFDIKLRDGRIINVRQPNKDLFNDTFKMIKLIEANGEDEKISMYTRAEKDRNGEIVAHQNSRKHCYQQK